MWRPIYRTVTSAIETAGGHGTAGWAKFVADGAVGNNALAAGVGGEFRDEGPAAFSGGFVEQVLEGGVDCRDFPRAEADIIRQFRYYLVDKGDPSAAFRFRKLQARRIQLKSPHWI